MSAAPASAIDEAHLRQGQQLIDRAVEFLRSQQDTATGGWSIQAQGSQFPAITGLVLDGMLMEPAIDEQDPAVARGVAYLLSFHKPDGGIYDDNLASYNTSICLSALSRINDPKVAAVVAPAQKFLRSLQWTGEATDRTDTQAVTQDDPFFGGVGYGSHGRPDNSNLGMMLQAMHDSGLSSDDDAYKQAVVFLQRTQMDDRVNDMPYAQGSRQGGFIYSTGPDANRKGEGETKAGSIEEVWPDGGKVSRLRAYGSMTYTGFKSYLYANLSRSDQRVELAYDWIRHNYTLEENPGVGMQGFYYYLVTFSRALEAWGLPEVQTIDAAGVSHSHDWANDLIDRLGELQQPDGSFQNLHDRWMEGDPVLVTAYALIALEHAIR